jgi:hypothetical protein
MRTLLTLAILMAANLLALGQNAEPRTAEPPIEVKVLVLNFDPKIKSEGGKRLHEVCGWNDPHELAKGYIDDLRLASHNLVRLKIVDWVDVDDFHLKADGFKYTEEEYMKCYRAGKGWHQPDGADYPKTIQDFGIIPRVESGDIDEVWWFGAPYFGYWESSMAGAGAFYINGGVYDKVPCQRAFAIMGFNYERGVAEMLHDLCHRTESTMARIYGGWKVEELTSTWARFAANQKQSGTAAVGTCHYPPNGESDYDYANKRFVTSTAPDWLTYPKLSGKQERVNCETWGGPDYQRNYMKWWFGHLPHVRGTNADDGRLNNWWRYVFQFNKYDQRGKPVAPKQ